MSAMKRYMDDIYYNKICEGKTQDLIDNGWSPEQIEEIRQLYEESPA